jgi:opacity protein-like surface antigen
LAYKRSRWSAEGYSLITSLQVPAAAGGVTRYTSPGAGTRADYRYTDHFSATVDVTASIPGSAATAQTAEVGSRYSPLPWDRQIRPFLDVRAAYMSMYDLYAMRTPASIVAGAPDQQPIEGGRYSRGFGGLGGAGFEYSLTHSFALTTEFSAIRNRMTMYRFTGPATIPNGNSYWMTSFRYTLGLKFNPVRTLRLTQNPTAVSGAR